MACDPRNARADAEYLADGIRLSRATGAFYGWRKDQYTDQDTAESQTESESEVGKLFTQAENTSGNKSPHTHLSHCPQCKKKAVEISNTYSVGDPRPDPKRLRWLRVD
jgi:hypothetical protein